MVQSVRRRQRKSGYFNPFPLLDIPRFDSSILNSSPDLRPKGRINFYFSATSDDGTENVNSDF